ncbi:hypothetical protein DP939_00125 [Spongiactinospora rosea]|uniref:Uncharacterized protein n=1 Tax=Spongiactinospora rosea TaxID=2248750 RepID=A0A366M6F7_9ACTN|nr:hypothetical protein DP939_00125 [Spongiactinospora rosea]
MEFCSARRAACAVSASAAFGRMAFASRFGSAAELDGVMTAIKAVASERMMVTRMEGHVCMRILLLLLMALVAAVRSSSWTSRTARG